MKETEISCMRYRKATHLSGLDVAEIVQNKGVCVLTIKEAYYDRNIDVAGKKVDGYFLSFQENGVKDIMLNSINRKTIAKVAKMTKNISLQQASMLPEWVGLRIELYFDENIKFGREEVGGIRVKPISPIPNISDVQGIAILNTSTNMDQLKSNWAKLSKQEQELPSITSLKDSLKAKLDAKS